MVLFIALIVLAWYLHETKALQNVMARVESFGVWAPVSFLIIYILTCIFFIPSLIFTFSGGVLFGFWKGFALSLAGSGLGSLAAFLIGRYLAHDFVAKRFAQNKTFLQLAEAARKQGWKIVALARLSPVFPFLIGNYAFGTTGIPARHYFGASLLGTIPSTALYTYLGNLLGHASSARGGARTWQEWVFLVLGLAATVFFAFYFRRFCQKSLTP